MCKTLHKKRTCKHGMKEHRKQGNMSKIRNWKRKVVKPSEEIELNRGMGEKEKEVVKVKLKWVGLRKY